MAEMMYKKGTRKTPERHFQIIIPKTLKYWVCVQQVSLTWGVEGASLALVGHSSSDGVTVKIPYGVDVLLHQPASHPVFSYWIS